MTACNTEPNTITPLTSVRTSKAWVLPPRPKPGRKPTSSGNSKEKKKNKEKNKDTSDIKRNYTQKPSPVTESSNSPISSSSSSPPASSSTTTFNNKTQALASSPETLPLSSTFKAIHQKAPSNLCPGSQVKITAEQEMYQVNQNIQIIENENTQLKNCLLALIHDYKHLRKAVLANNNGSILPGSDNTTARKRSYIELDPMHDLIDTMNDLSHSGPDWNNIDSPEADLNYARDDSKQEETTIDASELFDFIKLEEDQNKQQEIVIENERLKHSTNDSSSIDKYVYDIEDEEIDDTDSPALSRTTSPSETDCENSLMTSLTRSTTVSTLMSSSMSFAEKKLPNSYVALKDQPYSFYSLPSYGIESNGFTFDALEPSEKLSKALQEDQYNMVTDFLEEKLNDNTMTYYESKVDK